MSPTEFTHSPVIPIATPFDLTDYPELAGISGISGTGLVARIGLGSYATRTLTGTTNQVNVVDGNGVAGNPTISLPQNIHTAATPTFAGITLSGMTAGSILFAGTSGVVSQDNSNLYWDDSNNRLGIGTASPDAVMHVAGGATNALHLTTANDTPFGFTLNNLTFGSADTSAFRFFQSNAGIASFQNNSVNALQIGTTGKIGMGASPVDTTQLNLVQTATGASIFGISSAVTGANTLNIAGSFSATGATNNLGIHVSNGFVGIGTTTAANLLDIGGSSPSIGFYVTASAFNAVGARILSSASSGAWNASYIKFQTHGGNTSSFTDDVVIKAGEVGIGITPTASAGLLQLATGTTAASGILWGTDTNLYRDGANSLKTDDALTVTGIIRGANFTIGNAGGAYWGIVNDALPRGDANYAIQQSNAGSTIVGAPTGAIVRLAVNATSKVEVTGTALTLSIPTTITDTTASTSSTTGALIVSGGAGIAKALYVANDLVVTPAASANRAVTITGSNGGNPTIAVSAGSLAITPATVFASTITTIGGATFHTTSTALTNGAGAGAGTLTNAPAAGDPTKWIGINDNGTTRYIPAW